MSSLRAKALVASFSSEVTRMHPKLSDLSEQDRFDRRWSKICELNLKSELNFVFVLRSDGWASTRQSNTERYIAGLKQFIFTYHWLFHLYLRKLQSNTYGMIPSSHNKVFSLVAAGGFRGSWPSSSPLVSSSRTL